MRAYDGHVAITNKKTKQMVDVKNDLQLPGTLLMRDAKGQVYYVSFASLKQVPTDVRIAAVLPCSPAAVQPCVALLLPQ